MLRRSVTSRSARRTTTTSSGRRLLGSRPQYITHRRRRPSWRICSLRSAASGVVCVCVFTGLALAICLFRQQGSLQEGHQGVVVMRGWSRAAPLDGRCFDGPLDAPIRHQRETRSGTRPPPADRRGPPRPRLLDSPRQVVNMLSICAQLRPSSGSGYRSLVGLGCERVKVAWVDVGIRESRSRWPCPRFSADGGWGYSRIISFVRPGGVSKRAMKSGVVKGGSILTTLLDDHSSRPHDFWPPLASMPSKRSQEKGGLQSVQRLHCLGPPPLRNEVSADSGGAGFFSMIWSKSAELA